MRDSRGSVVVGVDGSVESDAALRYAMARARAIESTLDVVTVWTASDEDADLAEGHAARAQDRALAQVLAAADREVPLISRWVVRGEAGTVLERAARNAVSLVLGRPTGRGLVADYCAAHARVPLVLVPILTAGPGSLGTFAQIIP